MADFLFTALITFDNLKTATLTLDVTNQTDLVTATQVAKQYLIDNKNRWFNTKNILTVDVTVLERPISI